MVLGVKNPKILIPYWFYTQTFFFKIDHIDHKIIDHPTHFHIDYNTKAVDITTGCELLYKVDFEISKKIYTREMFHMGGVFWK